MKCVLDNFEPFDKFWFRSCFYQAFLSVAKYYGGNLNKYFANQIYRYELMDSGHLTVVRESLVRYNEVEGIREHRRKKEKNILRAIEDKIKKGYPVIVATDPYYIPHRNDSYLNAHGIHFICIYGFDTQIKRFFIIDHASWGSYKYEKKECLYGDILRAYTIYNKQNPNKFSFYWYSKDGITTQAPRQFRDDILLLKNYIRKFQTSLCKDVNCEGYRLFFEGETWLRVPVMEMFMAIGREDCYLAFNNFINMAKLIFVIMTKEKGHTMSEETKRKLSGYAERFLEYKIIMDKTEAKYYEEIAARSAA